MIEFLCVVGSLSSVLGALLQTDDTLHGVQSLHLEVIPARQVVKDYWPDHNAAASAIYNAFSSSHLAGTLPGLVAALCPRVAKNTTSDWYAGVMVVGRIGS